MRPSIRTATGFASLALLVFAGLLQAQDWRWSGTVDRGEQIEIRGVNGRISATAASGNTVEVFAEKSARRSDVQSVQIEVIEDSRGVLICAVYPDVRGEDGNRCGRGRDYEMNTRNNDVSVDFTVSVPAGVELRALTVNGDVEALGMESRIHAATVNGSIEISTTSYAEASTVNGSIEAQMESADWDGGLSFNTVNGGISLWLPDGVNADVEAQTVNGDLETDFPMQVQGRAMIGMRRIRGQIGGGGTELDLNTVNGSIKLKRIG